MILSNWLFFGDLVTQQVVVILVTFQQEYSWSQTFVSCNKTIISIEA